MRRTISLLYFSLLIFSCNTVYGTGKVQYINYSITGTYKQDTSSINLMRLYNDSLIKTMNEVLADVSVRMEELAKEPENIDIIIGRHTHTFLDAPVVLKNKKGQDIIVNQVGWARINLGRLDFEFSKFSRKKLVNSGSISVTKKTGE